MSFKGFWTGVRRTQLTYEEFDLKIEELKARGLVYKAKTTSKVKDWVEGVFSLDKRQLTRDSIDPSKREGREVIYSYDPNGDWEIFWACKKSKGEVKEQEIHAGSVIKSKFQELEGSRMRDVFGTVSSKEFRNLVPKPCYFIDNNFMLENIEGTKVIDITSMYPWAATGRMPTTKGMKTVQGRAFPSEEYPFAFYLKSNHVAEYQRFDTHDYLKLDRDFRNYMNYVTRNGKMKHKYNEVDDKDEVTVLMKAADKELTDTFLYFYHLKEKSKKDTEDYRLAKFIMNAGIGTFHKNPDKRGKQEINDYYHIAAIVKGRANQKIIDTFNQIREQGNIVLQVIVDGIIYLPLEKDNIGIDKKVLGEFKIEYEDVIYRSNGILNRYVISDGEKLLKVVLSGYEHGIDLIKKLEDIDLYNKELEEEE